MALSDPIHVDTERTMFRCPAKGHACRFTSGTEEDGVECVLDSCICDAPIKMTPRQKFIESEMLLVNVFYALEWLESRSREQEVARIKIKEALDLLFKVGEDAL